MLQAAVKAALNGKDVGVLVNNVGVSYPHPKYFHELTDSELEGLTTLNVTSTVAMTRLALPAMLEKRKGAIVNMASAAAVAPTALLSGYSGAKGYVLKLSESLNVEYAPKGIHVQCQVPLLVATKVRLTLHSEPLDSAFICWSACALWYIEQLLIESFQLDKLLALQECSLYYSC
jgi:17beta-estradiol 17-dehydrogenase / very-long-chain 3-oxoacyl-CoA reductase